MVADQNDYDYITTITTTTTITIAITIIVHLTIITKMSTKRTGEQRCLVPNRSLRNRFIMITNENNMRSSAKWKIDVCRVKFKSIRIMNGRASIIHSVISKDICVYINETIVICFHFRSSSSQH